MEAAAALFLQLGPFLFLKEIKVGKKYTRKLTPREKQVAQLGANGLTNREIAQVLGIKPRTVVTYWQNVFNKFGVSSKGGAIAQAMRDGDIG